MAAVATAAVVAAAVCTIAPAVAEAAAAADGITRMARGDQRPYPNSARARRPPSGPSTPPRRPPSDLQPHLHLHLPPPTPTRTRTRTRALTQAVWCALAAFGRGRRVGRAGRRGRARPVGERSGACHGERPQEAQAPQLRLAPNLVALAPQLQPAQGAQGARLRSQPGRQPQPAQGAQDVRLDEADTLQVGPPRRRLHRHDVEARRTQRPLLPSEMIVSGERMIAAHAAAAPPKRDDRLPLHAADAPPKRDDHLRRVQASLRSWKSMWALPGTLVVECAHLSHANRWAESSFGTRGEVQAGTCYTASQLHIRCCLVLMVVACGLNARVAHRHTLIGSCRVHGGLQCGSLF